MPQDRGILTDHLSSAGKIVATEAKHLGSEGLTRLNAFVQRGPAGISVIAFFGSLFTTVVGIVGVARLDLSQPFTYLINVYLILFGIVTFLLEMDPEKLEVLPVIKNLVPHVTDYQKNVSEYARFLTELRGRGLFYLFVGTLCITECILCLLFFAGIVNGFCGIMCLLMSYGVKPDVSPEAMEKAKQRAGSLVDPHQYQPVSQFGH